MQFAFFPRLMRTLPLIPLLQVAGVALTLRRWGSITARKGRARLILPLIPNLSLAAIPMVVQVKGARQYLRLFLPDLYWLTMLCGAIAAIWAFVLTGQMLRTPRTPVRRFPR
jgi:hypothetical protein